MTMSIKPELGVCYYPENWPQSMWAQDAKRMKETGISWVRIGEFAWSRLEPRAGVFDWQWLDNALEVLGQAGLKVVMGTPSATPPKWLCEQYPDMLAVDIAGNPRTFGSRRHYCFAHLAYRRAAARMAQTMAQRYGHHPCVQAWQIDNEYGCHATTVSYSQAARQGFCHWLARKYPSPDALNHAWGNVFWSMEYTDFAQIDLPHMSVTEANPAHWLDFRRFASDQVTAFNQAQLEAIRPHTDKPLIHNYMGRSTDFDHFAVGQMLDIAGWDSYPLGFVEEVLHEENDAWKCAYSRQGDPDFQAFHHDLYRAVGRGQWWVMEQQPGPVNWATYNPTPLDGMVKLWTMEAIAHGAQVVSYFRWRQLPFAQEQMHAGLLRPDGGSAQAQLEVQAVTQEIAALGAVQQTQAEVAIVFDYESQWAWEIQPQGQGFDYFRLVFEQYRALRKLGLSVDILPPHCQDFGTRKLVLIPGLMHWNASLQQAIAAFKGIVLAGPRTGLKTQSMQIPPTLGPDFAATTTTKVATLRPGLHFDLNTGGKVIRWFETLQGGQAIAKTRQGETVLVRAQNHCYLGAWLDQTGYTRIFQTLCAELGIATTQLPEGVRIRQAGARRLILNYNAHAVVFEALPIPAAAYLWQ